MATRNRRKRATKDKHKPTKNQLEYAKQVKRIKDTIRRAEKRGYMFGDNVIPEAPKRITKSFLKKMSQIRGNKLYALAEFILQDSGEIVTGLEGRKEEKKKATEKRKRTLERKKKGSAYRPSGGEIIADRVLDDFIAKLDEPTPRPWAYRGSKKAQAKLDEAWQASNRQKSTIKSITYSVIASEGKEALGYRLQENADAVNSCLNAILYDSSADAINAAATELASIIKGSPLTMGEMMDLGEQDEWNQYMGDEFYGED